MYICYILLCSRFKVGLTFYVVCVGNKSRSHVIKNVHHKFDFKLGLFYKFYKVNESGIDPTC